MITTEEAFFEERVHRIFETLERTLLAKYESYGPSAIADCPLGPVASVQTRIWDKVSRLNHLLAGASSNQESLEDTAKDLANYSVILMLLLRKQWPGVK